MHIGIPPKNIENSMKAMRKILDEEKSDYDPVAALKAHEKAVQALAAIFPNGWREEQEPLGAEFEAVWGKNVSSLYCSLSIPRSKSHMLKHSTHASDMPEKLIVFDTSRGEWQRATNPAR